MRRHLFARLFTCVVLSASVFITPGCGGGGGGKSTPESNLAVTTNPAVNTTAAPAVGPFNLTVTITSAMPAKGVTIDIKAARDGSLDNFFSTSVTSTKASNNFAITNTPVGEVCLVTVTVTSLSTSSNTWTGTYRYSAK